MNKKIKHSRSVFRDSEKSIFSTSFLNSVYILFAIFVVALVTLITTQYIINGNIYIKSDSKNVIEKIGIQIAIWIILISCWGLSYVLYFFTKKGILKWNNFNSIISVILYILLVGLGSGLLPFVTNSPLLLLILFIFISIYLTFALVFKFMKVKSNNLNFFIASMISILLNFALIGIFILVGSFKNSKDEQNWFLIIVLSIFILSTIIYLYIYSIKMANFLLETGNQKSKKAYFVFGYKIQSNFIMLPFILIHFIIDKVIKIINKNKSNTQKVNNEKKLDNNKIETVNKEEENATN